jgi:anti-sigma B factor antagonist
MKNITITISSYPQHKDITLLSVKGFIDTNTASEFDKSFQEVLGDNKFKLIVDLKDVNYISSAGWGLFVGEIKRIRNQKGDLFLVAMSPEVEEAYELLQFSTILKAFPSVEQAVQKGFGKSTGAKGSAASPMAGPQPVGKSQIPMERNVEAPRSIKEPSKPRWFERILNPLKWF